MVYQLSYVATIPHSSFVQTVATLKALTGVQSPQEIATYTLVTKPHAVFKPKFEPGKVNQIEQYYMKCVTLWEDDTSVKLDLSKPVIKEDDKVMVGSLFSGDDTKRIWTLQISDIPVAGKNQVCSAQSIYESTLVYHHTKVMSVEKVDVKKENEQTDTDGMEVDSKENAADTDVVKADIDPDAMKDDIDLVKDPEVKKEENGENGENGKEVLSRKDSFLQFLEDLGYDVVNQYWIKGIRFFYGDIVVEIFKLFIRDDSVESTGLIHLKLLDESNTFQIKAYINIPKSIDVDLISQGTKDILRFKENMKNLFKLEIPDRMYMDSRVPSK